MHSNIRPAFYLICLLLWFSTILYAQPEVDETRAVYARVIDHLALDNNNKDTLFLEDASGFAIGDTVLFHYTIGGVAYDIPGSVGEFQEYQNAGIYGIYLIDTID